MKLDAKIEAILFWKGEAIKKKKLAEILEVSVDEVEKSLKDLEKRLSETGLTLTFLEDEVQMSTCGEVSEIIEKISKEELMRDLGKAGLETISIVLYKGPISRTKIDYIRGVNSQFILRNLLVRGLVERVPNPEDSRSFLYKPTFNLLSHLGISKMEDLPEFMKVKNELDDFEKEGIEEVGESAEKK